MLAAHWTSSKVGTHTDILRASLAKSVLSGYKQTTFLSVNRICRAPIFGVTWFFKSTQADSILELR